MALKTITGQNALAYPKDVAELEAAVVELQAKVTALVALTTELKTIADTHVHSGVTVGAGDSGASDLTTEEPAVTL